MNDASSSTTIQRVKALLTSDLPLRSSVCQADTVQGVLGTVYSRHIEEPEAPFFVRVCRAPCFNVLFRPSRWEVWRVMAETTEGAMRIARYHFYSASEIRLLAEA